MGRCTWDTCCFEGIRILPATLLRPGRVPLLNPPPHNCCCRCGCSYAGFRTVTSREGGRRQARLRRTQQGPKHHTTTTRPQVRPRAEPSSHTCRLSLHTWIFSPAMQGQGLPRPLQATGAAALRLWRSPDSREAAMSSVQTVQRTFALRSLLKGIRTTRLRG